METLSTHEYHIIERSWLDNLSRLDKYRRWFFSHIERYLGDCVWEAGAGIGNYTEFLLNKKEVILSDIADDNLEQLKVNFKRDNNVKILKIDLLDESSYKPLASYPIDTILCINVLEHIANDFKAMAFMSKVLPKNGVFIFVGPNHKFLYNLLDKYSAHYRRHSIREVKGFFTELGFEIEEAFTFNILGALAWFWQGCMLRHKIIAPKSLSHYQKWLPLVDAIDKIMPFKFLGNSIVIIARKQ